MASSKKMMWTEHPEPTTAIQVRKYIDSCLEFLVKIPDDDDDANDVIYNHPWKFDTSERYDTLGLFEQDVRMLSHASCSICKCMKDDGNWKVGIANPFTHAQFMILCHKCHDELRVS